jgi:hypothetical protein
MSEDAKNAMVLFVIGVAFAVAVYVVRYSDALRSCATVEYSDGQWTDDGVLLGTAATEDGEIAYTSPKARDRLDACLMGG